jgi:hypothetical protein
LFGPIARNAKISPGALVIIRRKGVVKPLLYRGFDILPALKQHNVTPPHWENILIKVLEYLFEHKK